MIQEWKTDCIQDHEQCMQRAEVPLPKRILEITADHVSLREQLGSVAPYACLSHCWGLNGLAVKLTAATVGHLRDGIKTSDLPTTFRDAVEVCRYLGIYYIWIDALCKTFQEHSIKKDTRLNKCRYSPRQRRRLERGRCHDGRYLREFAHYHCSYG